MLGRVKRLAFLSGFRRDADIEFAYETASLGGRCVVDPESPRPGTDPQVGDRVAAAGPVQTGSFGQDQAMIPESGSPTTCQGSLSCRC